MRLQDAKKFCVLFHIKSPIQMHKKWLAASVVLEGCQLFLSLIRISFSFERIHGGFVASIFDSAFHICTDKYIFAVVSERHLFKPVQHQTSQRFLP